MSVHVVRFEVPPVYARGLAHAIEGGHTTRGATPHEIREHLRKRGMSDEWIVSGKLYECATCHPARSVPATPDEEIRP